MTGSNRSDWLQGLAGDDVIDGGGGESDQLFGNEGNDTLTGGWGDDLLDGGTGQDVMMGGARNDRYFVDDLGDVVDETGGSGIDTVTSRLSVDLSDGTRFIGAIENVVLRADIIGLNATGNDLANTLTGNKFRNILDGRGGNDMLVGLGGDDVYYIDSMLDVVDESAAGSFGTDRVHSSVSVDLSSGYRFRGEIENVTLITGITGLNASGNGLANTLMGNATRNVLDGRGGADLMRGLGGDDIYYVDDAGDIVDEAFAGSGGNDQIFASISVDLADTAHFKGAIERVTLLDGIAGLDLRGNAAANILIGNNLGNRLDGRTGADVMRGLDGDDTYVVDNAGDVVDEALPGSGGTDTVRASVSVDLTDTVHFKGAIERVALAHGVTGLNATGNGLANILTGNNVGNTLNGKGGNDMLTGGAGTDRFVFDTALDAIGNVDTITDFSVKDDTIQLDDAIFTLVGIPDVGLAAPLFRNTASGPIDADDRIVYDSATGALSYDIDGSGAAAGIQFAWLGAGLALTHKDFVII